MMDFAAKIEKNRLAILRIVGYWLFFARLLGSTRRTLPPRLSRFANEILTKLEMATSYLMIAAGAARFVPVKMNDDQNLLTISAAIDRLRAIQVALKCIRHTSAKRIGKPFWVFLTSAINKSSSRLTSAFGKQASSIVTIAFHTARAPPQSIFSSIYHTLRLITECGGICAGLSLHVSVLTIKFHNLSYATIVSDRIALQQSLTPCALAVRQTRQIRR